MKLNEAEMRMAYQIEATSQNAALNEIYMTWRYTQNQATKDTAESLLAKLRPLSDKECMDMIREVQTNYHLPGKARTVGEMLAEARQQSGAAKLAGHDIMALERFDPDTRHMIVFDVLYDIPPSALEDETFAALITEAEKYIGYPYVWGGSNPNTSFDCSGFVSWALTQSGVCNTGRLGAQGLYNISTPVSSANARPGDLIFFVGTYDTPGVSHVGIYVGGGKMLHCGDPIQYADINTSYWQSHFYAFGRPPYN